MKTVITGTSRGIGLELTKQALENGDQVMAYARNPQGSRQLMQLEREYPQLLSVAAVDVASADAAEKIISTLKSWSHVDTLINNAGILTQGTSRQDFLDSFTTNSIAPFEIATALLQWLKKSASAKVVNVTSLMGSVEDNDSGGYYAYRSSKCALNIINKSFSLDHKWLTTVVIHPGWVQTDMGGRGAPTSAEESALGIWTVTRNLKLSNSGEFCDYRGKQLSW